MLKILCFKNLVLSGLTLVIPVQLMAEPTASWINTLGKLHPIVVHFPVALILVAALLEFLDRIRDSNAFRPATNLIAVLGVVSSVFSVFFGLLLIQAEDYGDGAVDYHKWSGIGTSVLGVLVLLVIRYRDRKFALPFLILTSLGVILTGHLGALVTHGEDYWSTAAATPVADSESSVDAGIQMDQNVKLRSILAHNCYSCHGPAKVKGELRMDSRELLFKGGKHGSIIVPGKPEASELIRRIRLPKGHKEVMPAKGALLTESDIRFLEDWIKAGAPWPEGQLKSIYPTAELAPRLPEIPQPRNGLHHPLDRLVDRYFQEHQIKWPSRVDDRTFIRRVYLDIIGLPPPTDDTEAFIRDKQPQKHTLLVDRLLNRKDDYAQHWLSFWNDALRNDYTGTGYITGGRFDITSWLYRSLEQNKPYDLMVRELVSPVKGSEGFIRGIQWRGVVNASQRTEMQAAQNVAQVFLGLNLKCASCHDSFISDWKLEDAYAFANIFADTVLEINRCDKPTGRFSGYRILYPELGSVTPGISKDQRLRQLADSLIQFRNGRLARTLVNRVWSRLMGRGIVEPLDAMDNAPWSRDVLDWLSWDFAEHGFDIRRLIKTIVTSQTYRLQSVSMDDPEQLIASDWTFRGMIRRRLSAEQFADAVSATIGPVFPDSLIVRNMLPAGIPIPFPRASLVPNEPFLKALGRPGREMVITGRGHESGLLQALEFTNGERFAAALRKSAGDWVIRFKAPDQFADAAYRKILGRAPTESERRVIVKALGKNVSPDTAEDVLWSLTLHPEFQLIY